MYPGLRPGLSSARPVQVSFEGCLGSATALSLQRPSPFCHPERSRGICGAPFVCPAPTGPNLHQSSPNPHGNTNLHFVIPSSRSGPRNRRSLGFARDDKKERVVARKRRLLNRGIFQIGLQPSLRDSSLASRAQPRHFTQPASGVGWRGPVRWRRRSQSALRTCGDRPWRLRICLASRLGSG
jgi:hypothetical protein